MNNLCPVCGWGFRALAGTICNTVEEAVVCSLNWENRRKYAMRFKDHEQFAAVRSVRYQGAEGKGDSSERLEPITIEQLRALIESEGVLS